MGKALKAANVRGSAHPPPLSNLHNKKFTVIITLLPKCAKSLRQISENFLNFTIWKLSFIDKIIQQFSELPGALSPNINFYVFI